MTSIPKADIDPGQTLAQPTPSSPAPASAGASRRDILRGGSAATAGALFGSIGLTACGGGGEDAVAEPAQADGDTRRTAQALDYSSAANINKIFDSNEAVIGTVGAQAWSERVPANNGPFSQIAAPSFVSQQVPAVARLATSVPCGAFWYQDFGLEYTRNQSNTVQYPTWLGWYDWRWNHTVNRSHEPNNGPEHPRMVDRHPMLGWYRGDMSMVLAWQVKWLVEHGVQFAICQQRSAQPDGGGGWVSPSNIAHWIRNLINLPSVGEQGLQLAFWVPHSSGLTKLNPTDEKTAYRPTRGGWNYDNTYAAGDTVLCDGKLFRALLATPPNGRPRPNRDNDTVYWAACNLPDAWKSLADFYLANRAKVYSVRRSDGRRQPLVYFHEGEVCRDAWGTVTLTDWLKQLAKYLKDNNPAWSGVSVLMRNSTPPSRLFGSAYGGLIDYDDLEANGVLLLRGDYNGLATSAGASGSYEQIINRVGIYEAGNKGDWAVPRRVFTAVTSLESHPAHDSHYNFRGHSPANFKRLLEKIVPYAKNGSAFPLLMVNNVSEWAESGPGLQPNKQDGFGYLKALKDVLTAR